MRLTVNGIEIPDAQNGLKIEFAVACEGEEMGPVVIEVNDGAVSIVGDPHSITLNVFNGGQIRFVHELPATPLIRRCDGEVVQPDGVVQSEP